ncbi:hypothetical protein [Paenibacillus sp. LjRoot56]|uniref:hypothetical protein n=1 Tax=Paenibacillus sp. LjRoot56 TaxID=3342333 RepID=UPI003ECC9605
MQIQSDGFVQWIWSDGEESHRNEWRCFRKSFDVPSKGWDSAKIAITADSRYVLYINGELLGRGQATFIGTGIEPWTRLVPRGFTF